MILVGFPYSGKTTFGKLIFYFYSFDFCDLDFLFYFYFFISTENFLEINFNERLFRLIEINLYKLCSLFLFNFSFGGGLLTSFSNLLTLIFNYNYVIFLYKKFFGVRCLFRFVNLNMLFRFRCFVFGIFNCLKIHND